MAGKRISRQNMTRIQQIADHAYAMGAKPPGIEGVKADMSLNDQLQVVARAVYGAAMMPMDGYCCIEETFDTYVIIEVSQNGGMETYYRADYTMDDQGAVTLAARDAWVEVEEVWQPVERTAKAGTLLFDGDDTAVIATIKALGDRTLELRVAWGWDNHKEQFHSEQTDFDTENFPTPPVAYYHGYTEKGKPAPKPVYIGRTIKRENRADGHYLIAKLNNKPEADRVWEAALKGNAVVSPATAGHLRRKAPDGTLTYWPIVEISAWDYAPSRKQAHPQSRAFPILKALYQEADIPLPPTLEHLPPPETPGDGVSAGVNDISLDIAGPIIAHVVAQHMLGRNRRSNP